MKTMPPSLGTRVVLTGLLRATTQRYNVFGQPLITAVHAVIFHAFRESAGFGRPSHGFCNFPNVERLGTAARPKYFTPRS